MENKKHIHEIKPYEADIVVDKDNDQDMRAIGSGCTFVRVLVYGNGKRGIGWVSISERNGKVVLRLTAQKGKKEIHKDLVVTPWLDLSKLPEDRR